SFRLGHDSCEPVHAIITLDVMDLIGPGQGVVDSSGQTWDTAYRIKTLVRIHLPDAIRVRGHLPSADIDRFQAGLDLLHGLVARESAQSRDVRLGLEQVPQSLRAHSGQRVLY